MGLGVSIGYIQYVFPSADEDSNLSQEAYIGLSLDNAISPALTFYYGFWSGRGLVCVFVGRL